MCSCNVKYVLLVFVVLNVLVYCQVLFIFSIEIVFGFHFIFLTAFIYEFEQTNIPFISEGKREKECGVWGRVIGFMTGLWRVLVNFKIKFDVVCTVHHPTICM